MAKQLNGHFELGLKLVMEKTGQNRFFINREALVNPESFIGGLIRNGLSTTERACKRKG